MAVRRKYHVSELKEMSTDEVWALPDGGLEITFDDGQVGKFKTRTTIYSWYYWTLAVMANAPTPITHHIGNGDYKSWLHCKFAGKVFWDNFHSSPNADEDLVWALSEELYAATNRLYNDVITKLDAYHSSMCLEDVMDIVLAPQVQELKAAYKAGDIDEIECHQGIFDYILSGAEELKANEIAKHVRADLLDRRQMSQMIGPRANIADINGVRFKSPIIPGYAEGMDSLYDSAIESRTASYALYQQGSPLEISEYNARVCNLLTSVIKGINHGDCGTTKTMTWLVGPEDLNFLSGKYMVAEDGLRMITPDDNHLIGKDIELRTMFGCKNKDPSHVCSTCFGHNSWVLPPGTNLGNHSIIEALAAISQTILSTKHVIANAIDSYIEIQGESAKFIRRGTGDNKNRVYVAKRLKGSLDNWTIQISHGEVTNLNGILTHDVERMSTERTTSVKSLYFIKKDKHGQPGAIQEVATMLGGHGSPLSIEMLRFLKHKGWKNLEETIEISLEGWDIDDPIIETIARGEDIMFTVKKFIAFVNGRQKDEHFDTITDYTTPERAMLALQDILHPKVNVNFTAVEVFIRALQAKERSTGSYNIPSYGEAFRFINIRDAVTHRSLGTALGFQGQGKTILSPETYLRGNSGELMSTPLDHLWATE